MVTVIFPAAGRGKRMKAKKNKVFLELSGKPVLLLTLEKFSACSAVDDLIIASAKEDMDEVKKLLDGAKGLKPYKIVEGGAQRQYSIHNAIKALDKKAEIVLVHDAARPLVSKETIEAVIEAAKASAGAIAAVPAKNTIKIVSAENIVVDTPARETLWEVQTPQGFKRELLERAYETAEKEGFLGTDDASLVERLGAPVSVVMSEYENIKLTTPEDILIAEAFLAKERSLDESGEAT